MTLGLPTVLGPLQGVSSFMAPPFILTRVQRDLADRKYIEKGTNEKTVI